MLTTAELAEVLDVDVRTVTRWIGQGVPHDKPAKRGLPNRFNEAEVVAWMKSNNLTGQPGRQPEIVSDDLEAARIRKENALADKYELQVARERGELVVATDVEAANVQKFATIRNKLLGMPASLAPSLVGLDAAAIHKHLDDAVLDVLNELSAG